MKMDRIMAILLTALILISSLSFIDNFVVQGSDGNFGGGSGTAEDPYLIEDVFDLQAMNDDLSAHYVLVNDIDASITSTWNDGTGFDPIGEKYYDITTEIEDPFTGSLDGNGHTISGLHIDIGVDDDDTFGIFNMGLFSYIGSEGMVMNLDITGSIIELNTTSGSSIGGLAGYNEGSISKCYFQGRASGITAVGGLIGSNFGKVVDCHSDITVDETGELGSAGGLIGLNAGAIEDCSSKGIVSGSFYTGGLVGANGEGFVNNSFSECEVNSDYASGGLIGRNGVLQIINCFSTGPVFGNEFVGGLIGQTEGDVTNCYSISDVRGMEGSVGGLIGYSIAVISNCYSTGDVYGGKSIGGLIGWSLGNVSNCHSVGDVTGVGNGVGGLLGSADGTIEKCYSVSSVYGANHVGGFVGQFGGPYELYSGRISECFSMGNVTGTKIATGGFAGTNIGQIENCFSLTNVVGTDGEVGGFIGNNKGGNVSNCYSSGGVSGTDYLIGGFVGVNNTLGPYESSTEHCYWDIDTSGQNTSDGGEGRTTMEMRSKATFEAWDFNNIWSIVEGEEYPYLQALINAKGASILSPRHIGTLVIGDSLRFIGSSSTSPEIGYRWIFDDDRTSLLKNPGLIPFNSADTKEISYSYTLNGKDYLEKDSIEFEVIDAGPSIPDLIASSISIPGSLGIGDTAEITYTVDNMEDSAVSGQTWKDSLYLSNDQYLDSKDIMLNSTMVSRNISGNGGYSGSMNITAPPLVEGPHYLILSVNDDWSFVERHRLNNEKQETFNIAIPELKEGIEQVRQHQSGTLEHYYMIKLSTSQNIHLSLNGPKDIEMMLCHEKLPTLAKNDHYSKDGEIMIPSAYSGTWYVMVHGSNIDEPGSYSIQFDVVELLIENVAPSNYITGVPFELYISGIGFTDPLQVILAGSDGSEHQVPLVDVDTPKMITAHVKGNLLSADVYDVRVVMPGKGTAELGNVLKIIEEGEPNFEAEIDPGQYTGYHEHSTVYVEYSNTGDIAMRAPLLFLTAVSGPDNRRGCLLTHDQDRLRYGIWTAGMKAGTIPETPADRVPEGFQNELMILASGEVPGLLQAGETRRIPIYYVGWEPPYPDFGSDLEWQLYIVTQEDDDPMDWSSAKEKMMPDDFSDDAWDIIWDNFVNSAGTTYGDFIRTLNENALYLYQHGQRVEDIDEILSLNWQQAIGWTPYASLFYSNDVELACPGIDLSLIRSYPNAIQKRFVKGDLGWGWMHSWQYSLSEEDDGTVKIEDRSGELRIFQPNIRSRNAYIAQPGDRGELTEISDGNFKLYEPDGNSLFFGSDGKIGRIEDLNGNTINCEYTGGHLSRLVHSCGSTLELTYDSNNLIDTITDNYGRTTTYTYDEGYLSSVEYYNGFIETYFYDRSEGSASEHSLVGYTPAGESRFYLEYNSHGALRSHYREGDLEKKSFIYGRGQVWITDLLGNTERYFHDHQGRMIRYDDALGSTFSVVYDNLGRVETISDPSGLSLEYDNSRKSLVRIRNRAGNDHQFKYCQDMDKLEMIRDPTGSSMVFDLDENGNLIGVVYPDGSRESGSYDEEGNLLSYTNRRDNTTSFTYDQYGRITSKTYSDGSEIDYRYDARGNLVSMEDLTGTTNFTYNNKDEITRIDYQGGKWLEFTYDGAGRRSAIVDQEGKRINYDYDQSGRLEGLTTSTGIDIVKYEYDQLGRLTTKTLDNGVYTTLGYDAANRVTKLANFKSDETVISWFNYSYDQNGRQTKLNTNNGTWYYTYDDRDQLVNAVFDPTHPDVDPEDIEYNYDAMGNRVRTVVNGVERSYRTNNMNQYITAGNITFGYDLDGNLISEEGPDGTITYVYNDDNRLISSSRGEDHREYSYDGLGNRVSITENGNTSYMVVDPGEIGNVVGVYDDNGTMLTRYIHGLGLVSMETGAGETYFYDFDMMGNTQELTDAAGSVVNSYSYFPFGGTTFEQETVHNPFRFVGEKGVMTDSTGLLHMRARQYDPQIGRFISIDPLGISGGDINFYRYALNSPTNFDDPEGLSIFGSLASKGIQVGNRVLNTYQVTNNFVPYGSAVEQGARNFISPIDAQFIGSGVDIVTGIGSILSLGATYSAALALMGPVGAVVAVGVVAGAAVYGIYKGIKFIASLFDFEPANTLTPLDPNHKECLNGMGPGGYVAEGTSLSYKVEFENMKEATAPAQIVTIMDPLSDHLDWSTFEFTEIGYGDTVIPIEPGTRVIDKVIEYHYQDDEYDMDFELHINGEIDTARGEIFVFLQSIDPDTELPPGVDTGFLPPEDGTGRGQGYFMYNIDPKPDLPSGTQIRNIATIQFNLGMEIDTNQVDPLDRSKGTSPDLEALVTIDAGAPSSSVKGLPARVGENFEVSWGGEDDPGGSGISSYDVYMKKDDGDWEEWLLGTNETSAHLDGELNSTYNFYCAATDLVGHREDKAPLVEATSLVSPPSAPVADAGPDQEVEVGTIVTFDGSSSYDEIGIVNFTWTIFDGYDAVYLFGVSPSYICSAPGNLTVRLNVSNSAGLWDTDTVLLTVEPPSIVDDDDDDVDDDTDDDDVGSNENSVRNICILSLVVLLIVLAVIILIVFVIIKNPRKSLTDEE